MAQSILEEEFQADDGFEEVEIDFHGGEPFLAFETMRAICEWAWHKQWRRPFLFFATTNGTLVHGGISEWLHSNRRRICCSLSVDGTPTMHNLNRSDSFPSIDIQFFQAAWPSQPMKMTISPDTLPLLASGVKYLHEHRIVFTCNLACGVKWPEFAPLELVEQVKKIIEFYLENPEIEPCNLLRLPLETLGPNLESTDAAVPRWCGIGDTIRAYDVDGTRYPCQSAISFDRGENGSDIPLGGINPLACLPIQCKPCLYKTICRTCYAANYKDYGDPTIRGWMDCWSTKILAEATTYLFGMILRRDVLPAYLELWSTARLASLCLAVERVSQSPSLLTHN